MVMSTQNDSVYTNLVRVTHFYLGPSSERFIERQIRSHLNIEPKQVRIRDVKNLIGWIRLSMAMLTDDDKSVRQYVKELEALSKKR
jgi:hypothetical protein